MEAAVADIDVGRVESAVEGRLAYSSFNQLMQFTL